MGKKKEKVLRVDKVKFDADNFPLQKDNQITICGYTLLPPNEDTPENLKKRPAYITELELQTDNVLDMFLLPSKASSFKKTKNPVYLIEAFLLAREKGIYPPIWVLDSMAEVFKKYHKALGYEKYPKGERISLDDLFGFKKGKGETLSFKKLLLEQRDEMLMLDMHKLILVGYSIPKAAALVKEKLLFIGQLKALSIGSIETMYRKKWKKFFQDSHVKDGFNKWLADEDNKNAFVIFWQKLNRFKILSKRSV